MQQDDATRELDKIIDALKWAGTHLTRTDEANASKHLADKVLHTPLTVAVERAAQSAAKLREHLTEQPVDEPQQQALARIVTDLDRCPHGRHEGDSCAGWTGPSPFDGGCAGGISLGNPHLKAGGHLGYAYSSRPYVMPDLGQRNDPEAWKA